MSDQVHNESGVTRREFVKTSAVAALPVAVSVPWAHAQGSDEIRVGVVGCGGRGSGAAKQALAADPGVVIVAMGDMFSDRLGSSYDALKAVSSERVQVPPERRFAGFSAADEVIGSDIDVVILATPPHFRPAHLKSAVAAGKHIFCEKPMAVDSTGVRSVLESVKEAKAKNLAIVAGFCWRYSDPERATYKQIHEGGIGDIVSMHTTYHASPLGQRPREVYWSDMEFQLRNWWHFRWLSGDHIVEQACHSIDKINWAMNDMPPAKATAIGGRLMRQGEASGNVYDHFSVIYEYPDGQRCFHTCRQMPHSAYDNTDYIMGTEGTCFINGWGPTHVIKGPHPWTYDGKTRNMYQVEHDELFASLRSGEPINDGDWMATSTLMSIMGRMSAYTGQPITWDEALTAEEDWAPSVYAVGDLEVPNVALPGGYEIAWSAT
jgi:predicted dehydrogenase